MKYCNLSACHIQCLNSLWATASPPTPDKSLYTLAAAVRAIEGTPAFDPPCERLTWFWLSVKTHQCCFFDRNLSKTNQYVVVKGEEKKNSALVANKNKWNKHSGAFFL